MKYVTIAIIGRYNVGKSTLFNQLTHTNDALVSNYCGLTCDRKYGYLQWKKNKFIFIDTPGIDNIKKNSSLYYQLYLSIQEANIILLLIDNKIMNIDLDVINIIRKKNKNIIIIINKNCDIYHSKLLKINTILKINFFNKVDINYLLNEISLLSNALKTNLNNQSTSLIKNKNLIKLESNIFIDKYIIKSFIKVAIIGRSNVGKSTFINSLLNEQRIITCNKPSTTRDNICIPVEYKKHKYILVDTAGINKYSNSFTVENLIIQKTLKSINNSDIVLFIIDAYEGILKQDLFIINFIIKINKPIVIAINKLDKLSKKEYLQIKTIIDLKLKFLYFVKVHFISALNKKNIFDVFKSINKSYQCKKNKFNTSSLMRIMHKAINEYQPPSANKKKIKLKYIHIKKYDPLIILIHGTNVENLSSSYKRYLIKYFYKYMQIIGVPIYLKCINNKNPFLRKFH